MDKMRFSFGSNTENLLTRATGKGESHDGILSNGLQDTGHDSNQLQGADLSAISSPIGDENCDMIGQVRRTNSTNSEVDIALPEFSGRQLISLIMGSRAGADNYGGAIPQELLNNEWMLPSFLKSFKHYDYRADLEEISETRDPYTFQWVFGTEEMEWFAADRDALVEILWLTGHPGIGKSTLASYVVHELHSPEEVGFKNSSVVLYSFCHYQRNYTPSMVLAVAIHQVLYRYPDSQRFALNEDIRECVGSTQNHIRKAKHRGSWTLWRLLNVLINHIGVDEVYFVIDAFNVLEEDAQKELLSRFATKAPGKKTKTKLKLFITSTPSIHAKNMQVQWSTKCPDTLKVMDATKYEDEFDRDIEDLIARETKRIKEVQGYSKANCDLIDAHLSTYEHKRFLPVKLYFKQLEVNSPKKVGEILHNVSRDISSLYENLVKQLPEQLLSDRSSLVTFITYAYRTLSIQELAFSCKLDELGIDQKVPFAPEKENPLKSEYIKMIRIEAERYFPMLKIRQDQVTFFHDSIRQYVLARTSETHDSLISSPVEAHTQLALLCIRTILYKSELQTPESWRSSSVRRLIPNEHVFLSYAMQFWLKHVQQAVPNDTPIDKLDKRLLGAVKDMIRLWSASSSAVGFREVMLAEFNMTHDFGSAIHDLTPLEVLSALGLEPFLRLFVTVLHPSRSVNRCVENAVKLAIKGGHDGCFSILKETFDITSLEGDQYENVLIDSARSGRPHMIEEVRKLRLLKITEMVEALIASFVNGDQEFLSALTRDKSIFSERNHFGMNALHAVFAYASGKQTNDINKGKWRIGAYVAICGYLIENGVRVSSRDNYGHTPLHWACRDRNFCTRPIIEFLVSRGASVFDCTLSGLTAFHFAAYYAQDTDALQCLIELGTNSLLGVASRGRMSPLHWAITRPKGFDDDSTTSVMEFLLRHGADIRAENLGGISPLEWGGVYRGELLQVLYSGLQGVDLISISITYNPNTAVAIYWAAWSDVDLETLEDLAPALHVEDVTRVLEPVQGTSMPLSPRIQLLGAQIHPAVSSRAELVSQQVTPQARRRFRERLKHISEAFSRRLRN